MDNLFYKMARIIALVVTEESPVKSSDSLYGVKSSPTCGLQARAQLQEVCMQDPKGFQLCRHGQVTKKQSICNAPASWDLGCPCL